MDNQGQNNFEVQPPEVPTTPTPAATQPINATPPQPIATPEVHASNPSSKMVYIILGVLVLIVVVGAAGLFLLYKKAPIAYTPSQVAGSPTPSYSPSPVASPVTPSNVDQTLNTTDGAIQSSVNQANTDLNQVNSTNSSQDTTTGL